MTLDFNRIASIIDIDRMQSSHATVTGNGGGANLCRNLVRCGLGSIALVDFDIVENVNICRQEHMADAVGTKKVEALAAELLRINPDLHIELHARNFCAFTDDDIDWHFGHTDLFVFAVDNLAANARGNEVALRMRKPAIWSGVYARGAGGEIAFWHDRRPLPCFQCLCGARYRSQQNGAAANQPTDSADVLSVQFVDSITGMVAVGMLTSGSPTFYGRLIDDLGDRNFLHVKVHDWTWRGRDIIREQLQIPADCDTFFAWNTAARRDPTGGDPPCPDCIKFLGRVSHVPTDTTAAVARS